MGKSLLETYNSINNIMVGRQRVHFNVSHHMLSLCLSREPSNENLFQTKLKPHIDGF